MTATGEELQCIELVELITEWMEHALSDDIRAQVEAHLAICPDCEAYVDQLRLTSELLAQLDVQPTRGPADQLLVEAVRRRGESGRST